MRTFNLKGNKSVDQRNVRGIRVNSHGDEDGQSHSLEVYSDTDDNWHEIADSNHSNLAAARSSINDHNSLEQERMFTTTHGSAGHMDSEAVADRQAQRQRETDQRNGVQTIRVEDSSSTEGSE